MTNKPLVFRSGLTLSLILSSGALTLAGCSSDGATDSNTMPVNSALTTPVASSAAPAKPTSAAPVASSAAPAASTSAAPVASSAPSAPATSATPSASATSPAASTAPVPSSSASLTASATTPSGSSSAPAASGSAGPTGSSTAPAGSGSAGPVTPGDEDFNPTAEDFTCIGDWDQVLGFRINNFLGHLAEAKAVANNPAGGVYPVGTILQHLPTEAMVKRRAGFSAESMDWEFFILTLNPDGTTTISKRGPSITTSMGQTCPSCHVKADKAFDFVCNTWAEHGGAGNCGFDFSDTQLSQPIASDPRCD